MTLSLSQLREHLPVPQSDVRTVGETVLRFVRKVDDKPFAVYYLDISQQLPTSEEMLNKYQETVIGPFYFDDKKSLQWNNYLYFIVDREKLHDQTNRRAIELIEHDRNYARKLVIPEDEIDSVLKPSIVAPSSTAPRANVLSVWALQLIEAGLDKAIFAETDIPSRLDQIESSSGKPLARKRPPSPTPSAEPVPFLRSLHLKEYRKYPERRSFNFGKVNLFFGANGSGKTSLLEAIELLYCGRNRRNPESNASYTLVANHDNNREETATRNRLQREFRARNLSWYGQPEILTNDLCFSFARFNFLDTDAAVHLSDSTSQFDEDLSKLLIGPDASRIWDNIERVSQGLNERLRTLRPRELELQEEITSLQRRQQEVNALPEESSGIKSRLVEMIRRNGWLVPTISEPPIEELYVAPLSELGALVEQAVALEWVRSPVSVTNLTHYTRSARATISKADPDLGLLDASRQNRDQIDKSIRSARQALGLIEEATNIINAGVIDRSTEVSNAQVTVNRLTEHLADLDMNRISELSPAIHGMSVTSLSETASSRRAEAESNLAEAKREYLKFSKLRTESLNLSQELRRIAGRILETNERPDECPLCHTQFGRGELVQHMNVGVDQHLEALGQTLLGRIDEREVATKSAIAIEEASKLLKTFCTRTKRSIGIPVRDAASEALTAHRTLEEVQSKLKELKKKLYLLETRGLSISRLEEIALLIAELGFPFSPLSKEEFDRLRFRIQQNIERLSSTLATAVAGAQALEARLKMTLNLEETNMSSLKRAVAQLKERVTSTETILAKLNSFAASFPWPPKRPIVEYSVEAESIRKVAADFVRALAKEKLTRETYSQSIKQLTELNKRLSELQKRIKRFTEAKASLDNLATGYSLESAMQSALVENKADVEKIFLTIHSPSEFKKITQDLRTLIRKEDGMEASLEQISTGQRAAYALSIFLAQNARLSQAPRIILMDDPIAHIDDLNVLSFLDYLREVALKGSRQIFFATANEKVAALFERKFDFLGPNDFCRIELKRDHQAIP